MHLPELFMKGSYLTLEFLPCFSPFVIWGIKDRCIFSLLLFAYSSVYNLEDIPIMKLGLYGKTTTHASRKKYKQPNPNLIVLLIKHYQCHYTGVKLRKVRENELGQDLDTCHQH